MGKGAVFHSKHTHVHAGEDCSECHPYLWLDPIFNVVVQHCLVHSVVNRRAQSSAWRSEKHFERWCIDEGSYVMNSALIVCT
jgi:hypothetical protein